jgi:UDP-glucose 4-epimerase
MSGRETVLVTGGAGYIGSHALLALLEAGRPAVVLDDLSTGVRERVPEGVAFHQGSVADRELVRRVVAQHGVGGVLHFAGSKDAAESLDQPLHYYRNNVAAAVELLQAVVEGGARRFIFSSSAAVYAAAPGRLLDETAATGPSTPYGWSKLMAEQVIADAARAHGLAWMALRYFNVAGADPAGRSAPVADHGRHLVAAACDVAVGRRPFLPIFGDDYETPDGTCVRDFVHVTDLAEAHVLALDGLEAGGASGVYNCGYSRGVSVAEVAGVMDRLCGRPLPRRVQARRPGDLASVVADSRRLQAAVGWRPRLQDIEVILASSLAAARRASAAASVR